MEVELIVTFEKGINYTVHLKGDGYVIQSVLLIYTKQLLGDHLSFNLSFIQGDDQT